MAENTLMAVRRQELLTQLDRYLQDGVQRVNWLTTQDGEVCSLCAQREQRALTVAEARAILQGRFCDADEHHRGCRCALTVIESDFDEMP